MERRNPRSAWWRRSLHAGPARRGCLPTKASAKTVAIRPYGIFELHLVRAWHAQAAAAFAGPFRSGHTREGESGPGWGGRAMCLRRL
jgi:hypothetical protein